MTFKEARTLVQKRYEINIADAGTLTKDLLDNTNRLNLGRVRTEQELMAVLDKLEELGKE